MKEFCNGVRWGAVLLVGLAMTVTVAGCRRESDATLPPPSDRSSTSSSMSTSTTSTTVSYEVPAVIDAAYVEKVMKALDHVYGDAIRRLVKVRTLDEEFLKHLVALYTEKEFQFQQGVWAKDLQEGLRDRPAVPGDPITTVESVERATPICVVAAVTRDFSKTVTVPEAESPQHYVVLVPADATRDPLSLNPTPWTLSFDGWLEDGSAPRDRCAA